MDEADPAGPQARFERIPLPEAPEGTIQLIKHLTREAIWQPRFTAHANAAVALEEVVLAVPDPAETAARFSRLAGLPVVPDPAGGFALPMERGRVRMLPPEAVGAVYPGVAAPGRACHRRHDRRHRRPLRRAAPVAGRGRRIGRRRRRAGAAGGRRRGGVAVHLMP